MGEHRQPKTCCAPREFVEALDKLIRYRIAANNAFHDIGSFKASGVTHDHLEEECELLMRQITDYLLVNSTEKGITVHGHDSAIHHNACYRPPQ